MKKDYGLFGITGRYVTYGHIKLAELALSHFAKVIVMPCAQNRVDKKINVSSWDRWFMTTTAFGDLKKQYGGRLILSNRIVHSHYDYTTVEQIRLLKAHDERTYVVCVGSDNVLPSQENPQISRVETWWKQGKILWNEYPWAIFQRPGTLDLHSMRLPRNHTIIEGDLPDISSTRVREMMLLGEDWQQYMPAAEVDYILKQGLDI